MFALLSRVFGSVIIGLCLSTFMALLMTLFFTIRNLPNILERLQRLMRYLLRGSFQLYNAILSPLQTWVFQQTGFDIFHPFTRILSTIILSLVIGVGLLTLFSQPILDWELITLAVHGLFVGLAWEGILRSNDFQMGVGLE